MTKGEAGSRFFVVSLNIRQGGGRRQGALAEWLVGTRAGLLVLSEWRGSSARIDAELGREGFVRVSASREDSGANGLAMYSRQELAVSRVTPTDALRGELLLARMEGLSVLGAYFPQKQAKAIYFERCAELAAEVAGPLLLIGDLNTGCNRRDVEPGGATFHCAREFDDLCALHGLTDLWRAQHGDEARDWTWRSSKNGFRIDHAFGNRAFLRAFPEYRCEIDHSPRERDISDHSALIVRL